MGQMLEAFMAKVGIDKAAWNAGVASMKSKTSVFCRSVKVGFKSVSKDVKDFGKGLGSVAKWGAAGLTAASAAAIGFATKSIQAASAFEEASSKFDTVFKDQAAASREWSYQFAKDVGLSKTEVIKFMGATQDLFVPLGFARDKAADFSKKVVSLSADLASFNNMKTEDVIRDVHAALTGSAETMKKYGVVINQTKINQELMNMGIKDGTKAATEEQKAMAVMNLILRGTTDAQGDAIKTAGSFANTTKRLWARIEDLQVSIGQKLLPVVTPMINQMAKWVEANEEWIATSIGDYVQAAASQVKAWSEDGTFMLWWERAKLVVIGFKVALAGVQSALDYAIAGYYRLKAAKEYWTGSEADHLRAVNTARQYEKSASTRSVSAVNEYREQAQRVADASYSVSQRQRAVTAEPSSGGSTVINVNVENNGLQRIENKEADMIAEAVRKRMARGKVKSLAGG